MKPLDHPLRPSKLCIHADTDLGETTVTHNVKLQRFESPVGDAPPAFLSYTHEGEHVILDHTFVPDELRGRGLAAGLVRAALDEARQRSWRIIPRCSYVDEFIKRNPEFTDLVEQIDTP
jgi:predicted GNAT family acetyltransferase